MPDTIISIAGWVWLDDAVVPCAVACWRRPASSPRRWDRAGEPLTAYERFPVPGSLVAELQPQEVIVLWKYDGPHRPIEVSRARPVTLVVAPTVPAASQTAAAVAVTVRRTAPGLWRIVGAQEVEAGSAALHRSLALEAARMARAEGLDARRRLQSRVLRQPLKENR